MTSRYSAWAPPLMKAATQELGRQMEEAEIENIKTTIDLMAKHAESYSRMLRDYPANGHRPSPSAGALPASVPSLVKRYLVV